MAKNNSLFPFQGKLGEVVFVRSRYGDHVRIKRGTYKPATINDALKANAARAAVLNQLASPFYAALRGLAGRYCDGTTWSRILSRFRKVSSNDPVVLFSQLEKMNLHETYPLSRVWSVPIATANITRRKLLVHMQAIGVPDSTRYQNTDAFRYHLTALFKPGNSNEWQQDGACTDWMLYSGDPESWDFSFNHPAGGGVLCFDYSTGGG